MTITSTAPANSQSTHGRLNLAESKINWLLDNMPTATDPGTPPDLTALTAKVNRIYNLTVRGAESSGVGYMTADAMFDMDGDTNTSAPFASIISLTYGGYSMSSDVSSTGRNLKVKSFWSQVWGDGTHAWPQRTGSDNLASMALGNSENANFLKAKNKSAFGLTWGTHFAPTDSASMFSRLAQSRARKAG